MADLVRWEPFRDAPSLREAVDRLLEESFVRPGGMIAGRMAAMPAVDMYDSGDQVVVKASVPGVKPEEIEVTLTGDVLTIKGEFKAEEKVEKANYLRQERRMGSFCRQMVLPYSVEADKVSATFENGVLTLELPKAEQAKAKTVKVVAK